jgi:hypothetical protein
VNSNDVTNLQIAINQALPAIARRNRSMLEEMRQANESPERQFKALLCEALDAMRTPSEQQANRDAWNTALAKEGQLVPFCIGGRHEVKLEQMPVRLVPASVDGNGIWHYNAESPAKICVCSQCKVGGEA